MAFNELAFEKPINELKEKLNELKNGKAATTTSGKAKIARYEKKLNILIETTYQKLTPWNIVKIARHPKRPHFKDYIKNLGKDFIELHGDRNFRDDPAMLGGFITIGTQKLMIVGQEKGRDTDDKIYRNFGMASPEGYRKALRLMKLAEKFKLPIVTFIDTPGAYPGIGAEERGQSEAIARNLREMMSLKVPTLSIIIGEGGSGGALGIGVTDEIQMLQYSIYSVISPEGCASILFRDAKNAEISAKALKLTSSDLLKLKVIDGIIEEPSGGAHNNPQYIYENVTGTIINVIKRLKKTGLSYLLKKRLKKYKNMGIYEK
ncbi:acetyl-CoA carboxylase carboxyltransferase subunit alpha [bacterium]|nr:acetyl-CoA carboxylase carboxyltransferase subunit alpha [bacterium]